MPRPWSITCGWKVRGDWTTSARHRTGFSSAIGTGVRRAQAVRAFASRPVAPGSLDLAAQIQSISRDLGAQLRVAPAWLVGIVAVGVRTLQQAGLPEVAEDSAGAPDTARLIGWPETHPDRIVARRNKGTSQGVWGMLRGRRREWTVGFDERRADGAFRLIDTQHLTTAAGLDRRDYRSMDPRCTEGPIPVQCRSCSCGTCWVGVLAGSEHLSAVEPRERATISALGYITTAEPRPVVRLACMTQATGPVTPLSFRRGTARLASVSIGRSAGHRMAAIA